MLNAPGSVWIISEGMGMPALLPGGLERTELAGSSGGPG